MRMRPHQIYVDSAKVLWEVMSYPILPYPDAPVAEATVMVRAPGDPTTLVEGKVANLRYRMNGLAEHDSIDCLCGRAGDFWFRDPAWMVALREGGPK